MNVALSPVSELVPLSARIRNLQWLRGAAATVVSLFAVASDTVGSDDRLVLLTLATVYVTIAGLAELFWRWSRQRGLTVFGLLLVIDGLFLCWVAFETGFTFSPFRYLILVHAGAVALLASYRTGMKVALSHSLLLLVLHHASAAGVVIPQMVPDAVDAGGMERLVALIVAVWFMTIATASFSAVNERELRRRRYDLEALAAFAGDLDRATDARDVAAALLHHLQTAFDFRRGIVVGSQHGIPSVLATSADAAALGTQIARSRLIDLARERLHPLLVRNLDSHENQLAELLPDASSVVICPVAAEGRAFGAVLLEQPPNRSRIPHRVVSMTERFCFQAALALQNAWLVERLHAMAATDGLTGLANRRTFDAALQREISRGARTGSPVSLAMVDIDRFKPLNDTHGHQAGDDVLREVAQALKQRCRDMDVPARYGGEEFAVILPDTDATSAFEVAERLRQVVETANTSLPVTVSIGVATSSAGSRGAEDLIAAADTALYASKRAGRNRVSLAAALQADVGAA